MADSSRLEELRRRIQRDPASLIFAQLAEEHRRAGEHQEAVRVCRAGLRHHPEYHSARVTLGRSLLALGQLDDAEQELHLVLGAAPGNLLARRELGEIYLLTDRPADALDQLRAAQALAPQDPDLAASVAELERKVRPGAADGAAAGAGAGAGETAVSAAGEPATRTPAAAPYVIERSGEPPSELVEDVEAPAASPVQPPLSAYPSRHDPGSSGNDAAAESDAGTEADASTESDAGIELDAALPLPIAAENTGISAELAALPPELAPADMAAAPAPVISLPGTAAGEPGTNGASPNGLMSRLERWLAAIERSRRGRTSSH